MSIWKHTFRGVLILANLIIGVDLIVVPTVHLCRR